MRKLSVDSSFRHCSCFTLFLRRGGGGDSVNGNLLNVINFPSALSLSLRSFFSFGINCFLAVVRLRRIGRKTISSHPHTGLLPSFFLPSLRPSKCASSRSDKFVPRSLSSLFLHSFPPSYPILTPLGGARARIPSGDLFQIRSERSRT